MSHITISVQSHLDTNKQILLMKIIKGVWVYHSLQERTKTTSYTTYISILERKVCLVQKA